jgi:hypothetical protein
MIPATTTPTTTTPASCIDCTDPANFSNARCKTPLTLTTPQELTNPLILTLSGPLTSMTGYNFADSIGPPFDFKQYFELERTSTDNITLENLTYENSKFTLTFPSADFDTIEDGETVTLKAKPKQDLSFNSSWNQFYLTFSTIHDPFKIFTSEITAVSEFDFVQANDFVFTTPEPQPSPSPSEEFVSIEEQAINQAFNSTFNNTATQVITSSLVVASGAGTVVSSVGSGFSGGFAMLRWF